MLSKEQLLNCLALVQNGWKTSIVQSEEAASTMKELRLSIEAEVEALKPAPLSLVSPEFSKKPE